MQAKSKDKDITSRDEIQDKVPSTSNSGRHEYRSRPHNKIEKRLQKKARRKKRRNAEKEKLRFSLLSGYESERVKMLEDEISRCKRKISAKNARNLTLELQLDKYNANSEKRRNLKHANIQNKFCKDSSVRSLNYLPSEKHRDHTSVNCVSVDEIEYVINNESERILLGEGSFGACYLARLKRSGILVTVKLGQKSGGRYNQSLKVEAEILSKLSHPNIPFFFGNLEGKTPGLLMEFKGDSTELCSRTVSDASYHLDISCCDWQEIMRICSSTFAYIHGKGILHNDIKTNNVLLTLKTTSWIPTVIDFGKATSIEAKEKYPPLTDTQLEKYKTNYRHIAPELYIQRSAKSVSSDIYSFGWMLKCLKHCFVEKNIDQIFIKCLHSCPSQRPPSMLRVEEMLKCL